MKLNIHAQPINTLALRPENITSLPDGQTRGARNVCSLERPFVRSAITLTATGEVHGMRDCVVSVDA